MKVRVRKSALEAIDNHSFYNTYKMHGKEKIERRIRSIKNVRRFHRNTPICVDNLGDGA